MCPSLDPLLLKRDSVAVVSLQVHKKSAKFRQTTFILASSCFSCAFSLQNKPGFYFTFNQSTEVMVF